MEGLGKKEIGVKECFQSLAIGTTAYGYTEGIFKSKDGAMKWDIMKGIQTLSWDASLETFVFMNTHKS